MKSLGKNKISVCTSGTSECNIPSVTAFDDLQRSHAISVVSAKLSWYAKFISYLKNLFKGNI